MPEYVIKVKTELTLFPKDLEKLEDVVYDELTKKFKASTDVDEEGAGLTDVQAIYN
jgi:hypothetical protein